MKAFVVVRRGSSGGLSWFGSRRISAGRRGLEIELSPSDPAALAGAQIRSGAFVTPVVTGAWVHLPGPRRAFGLGSASRLACDIDQAA
jgi:hypothetical protein